MKTRQHDNESWEQVGEIDESVRHVRSKGTGELDKVATLGSWLTSSDLGDLLTYLFRFNPRELRWDEVESRNTD